MIEKRHKKPLLFTILGHIVVLCVLVFSFTASQFRMPPSAAPTSVIHASAVIPASADMDSDIKLQPKPTPPKPIVDEKKPIEDTQKIAAEKAAAAQAAAKQKLALIEAENAKIQAQKLAAAKKQKMEAQKKKLLADKKALAQKEAQLQQQQLIADKKALAAAQKRKLLAEQKKLQQQLMEQQLKSEMKNISAIQSQAQSGEIDQYKAQILAAIQSNWRIPEINNKLKCTYSVSIAPDGAVLSVKLVKSSGNDELDQSAKQAIEASSPLPVPSDPSIFSHFRQLMLTLSPQGYLQSVGN